MNSKPRARRKAQDSLFRDLIAERTDALHLTAGALQCVAKLLPAGEQHIVKFTGEWQHFGSLSIADILDRANLALDPGTQDGA